MLKTFAVTMLATAVLATTGENADVLLIGDSFFGFSQSSGAGNYIQSYCAGKKFKNRAISGSTALEWENNTPCGSDKCCLGDDGDGAGICSVPSAFATTVATGYSAVWISLGGNDYMDEGKCAGPAALQARLVDIFTAVKANSNFSAGGKILMTGYLMAKSAPSDDCGTAAKMSGLATIIKAACAAESRCTFIEATEIAGGSVRSWSPNIWNFVDAIHPSKYGYCSIMKQAAMQTFFGCSAPASAYDCQAEALAASQPGASTPARFLAVEEATAMNAVRAQTTADVLMFGDSFFGFSGSSGANNFIQKYCTGKQFKQRGISGSTALEWVNDTACANDRCCLPDDGNGAGTCAVSSALNTAVATGYSSVWITLGANDFMAETTGKCLLPAATVISRLQSIMTKVKADSNFSAAGKILMTSYPMPKSAASADCTSPALFVNLEKAIKDACAAESRCTFIGAKTIGGGSDSHFSPNVWNFADPVHLNQYGYCSLMKQPAMQTFFGCGAPPGGAYDCQAEALAAGITGASTTAIHYAQIEAAAAAATAATAQANADAVKYLTELNTGANLSDDIAQATATVVSGVLAGAIFASALLPSPQ